MTIDRSTYYSDHYIRSPQAVCVLCGSQRLANHRLESDGGAIFEEWHTPTVHQIYLFGVDIQQGDIDFRTVGQHNAERQANMSAAAHNNHVLFQIH